jgi:hypothetical protein
MANQVKLYAGESFAMGEGNRVDLVNDFGVPIYMSIEEENLYGPVTKILSLLGVLAVRLLWTPRTIEKEWHLSWRKGGVLSYVISNRM